MFKAEVERYLEANQPRDLFIATPDIRHSHHEYRGLSGPCASLTDDSPAEQQEVCRGRCLKRLDSGVAGRGALKDGKAARQLFVLCAAC